MRRLFLIASLFLLCCCGRRQAVGPLPDDTPHRAALDAVDSLMWCRPDSAFGALLAFNEAMGDTALCDWEECRFHLLLAELLYKNFYEQSNRAELMKAVSYFDSLAACRPNDAALAFLEARAHYINGVGCLEADSIVTACSEYLMALQLMEDHFEDRSLDSDKIRFMGLVNTRLASLFFYNDAVKQAILTSRKSLLYFERYGNPGNVANALMLVARCYNIGNYNDSAFLYYSKALSIAKENGFQSTCFNIMSEMAPFYYEKGMKDTAFLFLHKSLDNCIIRDDSLAICMNLGQLYYRECQYDTAVLYLEKSIMRESLDAKISSTDLLHDSYLALGEKEKAQYYGELHKNYMNHYLDKAPDKNEIATLYEKYLQYRNHTTKSERHGLYFFLAVISLLAICLVCFIFYIKSEKRKSAMTKSQLSGKVKAANQRAKNLEDLKRQLETGRYQPADTISPQAAASFADEPVCLLIMQRVKEGHFKSKVNYKYYRDYALDKPMLLDLRVAADHHFRQFTMRLKNDHPELTNGDLNYCCLYLLGLSDADVAALMQRAYNTVVERNKKIRRLLGSEKPLPIALKGIAECICS